MAVSLTAGETSWIKSHPIIRLGIDPKFAPFEFIDKMGNYRGMAADYIQLLNKRLGIQMQIILNLGWDEAVEKAEQTSIELGNTCLS